MNPLVVCGASGGEPAHDVPRRRLDDPAACVLGRRCDDRGCGPVRPCPDARRWRTDDLDFVTEPVGPWLRVGVCIATGVVSPSGRSALDGSGIRARGPSVTELNVFAIEGSRASDLDGEGDHRSWEDVIGAGRDAHSQRFGRGGRRSDRGRRARRRQVLDRRGGRGTTCALAACAGGGYQQNQPRGDNDPPSSGHVRMVMIGPRIRRSLGPMPSVLGAP